MLKGISDVTKATIDAIRGTQNELSNKVKFLNIRTSNLEVKCNNNIKNLTITNESVAASEKLITTLSDIITKKN